MYIEQIVRECDFTGKQYDTPQHGAGGIARGATGRWCVVMHAGPEYVKENNIQVLTREEAIERIEKEAIKRIESDKSSEHRYDWVDF